MKKTINTIIGKKIRNRRIAIGMSQDSLAKQIGITFQQIQKYEVGTNSLSVYRLYELCKPLKITPSYFLETNDLDIKLADFLVSDKDESSVSERELLEIIKSLQRIKDPSIRKRISNLIRSIADS